MLGRGALEQLELRLADRDDRLDESLEAFRRDGALLAAFGTSLVEAIVAVRESELEQFERASPEHVAEVTRWAH